MFLDGEDIGLGKVVITDSKASIYGVDTLTKCIDIYSGDHTYRFTFWTTQEYQKFNDLELNKKTDIMDFKYIDDYDISFGTKEHTTINTKENTEIYFTRIDIDKYIINAEIKNFDDCIDKNVWNHKKLELEAIIDFSNCDTNGKVIIGNV